jgi:hypothetical protein
MHLQVKKPSAQSNVALEMQRKEGEEVVHNLQEGHWSDD